jgi:hypothetical protein
MIGRSAVAVQKYLSKNPYSFKGLQQATAGERPRRTAPFRLERSSCLCPNAPHPHMKRRFLVFPGLRSSRI